MKWQLVSKNRDPLRLPQVYRSPPPAPTPFVKVSVRQEEMDLKLGSLESMGSNVPCDSPRVCFPTAASSLPVLAKCLLWVAVALTTSWHPFTFSGAAEGQKCPCAFRFLGETVPWLWVLDMAPDPLDPRRGEQGPSTNHTPSTPREVGCCHRLGRYHTSRMGESAVALLCHPMSRVILLVVPVES